MSKNLKRVPLDFKWFIGQTWKGYIFPYQKEECKCCEGYGLNEATLKVEKEWHNSDNTKWIYVDENRRYNNKAHQYHITEVEVLALAKEGRLNDLIGYGCWFNKELQAWFKWENDMKVPCDVPVIPSTESVNEWAKTGMGHDAINRVICTEARAKELGVYGECEYCHGESEYWFSEEIKTLAENHERVEPPIGDGFQLWNDNSPLTPVFESLDFLCQYLEDNRISKFGRETATKQEWVEMLSEGLVCHKQGNIIFM